MIKEMIKYIISLGLFFIAIPMWIVLLFMYGSVFNCGMKSTRIINCTLTNIVALLGTFVIITTIIMNLWKKELSK